MRKRLIALLDRIINWADNRLDDSASGAGVYNAKVSHDAAISAVVRRADGTIEDLGIIARGHASKATVKQLKKELAHD